MGNKSKSKEMECYHAKKLSTAKEPVNKMNTQTTEWEKNIYSIYI